MSDAMVFVLDVLDDPRALQGIRDDVLEMDLAVKRHMDTGLTPDEWLWRRPSGKRHRLRCILWTTWRSKRISNQSEFAMNINGTSGTPGLNVNELFNSGLDSISSKGKDLQAKMTEMLGKDEVSPEDMMALQFEVGQYNAMLESLSSVTKSMTDMMKSLAQRTG